MKCYGIVSLDAAMTLQQASWLTLASGSVLVAQDSDYTTFSAAIAALGGTVLPIVYDSTPLSAQVVAALAPISLPDGATLLNLVTAAGRLNPSLSF